MAPESKRLFFALWPDPPAADALHRLAERLHGVYGGRPMRRDTLHLTLAFLGDVAVDRIAALCEVAAAISAEPFRLDLDRLGYWSGNRVLWAGCSTPPDALRRLAETLQSDLRAAGFSLERRPFAAHVTLLRKARCDVLPAEHPVIGWTAEQWGLVESAAADGVPHYLPLQRWPL